MADPYPRPIVPSNLKKLTVLLTPEESGRLDAFCAQAGHKKSTLVARLIRDYLNKNKAPYPASVQSGESNG